MTTSTPTRYTPSKKAQAITKKLDNFGAIQTARCPTANLQSQSVPHEEAVICHFTTIHNSGDPATVDREGAYIFFLFLTKMCLM